MLLPHPWGGYSPVGEQEHTPLTAPGTSAGRLAGGRGWGLRLLQAVPAGGRDTGMSQVATGRGIRWVVWCPAVFSVLGAAGGEKRAGQEGAG